MEDGRRRTAIPKVLNHDNAKHLLEAHGWVSTIGGKHSTKMEKPGMRPITLPRHGGRDYGAGLRAAILRQAHLNPSPRRPTLRRGATAMSDIRGNGADGRRFTLLIHDEQDGMLWAEVEDLPGCFASGADLDELLEAAAEAIGMYLADPAATATAPPPDVAGADIHYAVQKAVISL